MVVRLKERRFKLKKKSQKMRWNLHIAQKEEEWAVKKCTGCGWILTSTALKCPKYGTEI